MRVPETVLLVDDEEEFRTNVADYLESNGYKILQAGDAESAVALAKENQFQAALVDIRLPGMDGIDGFIHKPYRLGGLSHALRKVLDKQ